MKEKKKMMIVKTIFREDNWESFEDEIGDLIKLYDFPDDLMIYDTENCTSGVFILRRYNKSEIKEVNE